MGEVRHLLGAPPLTRSSQHPRRGLLNPAYTRVTTTSVSVCLSVCLSLSLSLSLAWSLSLSVCLSLFLARSLSLSLSIYLAYDATIGQARVTTTPGNRTKRGTVACKTGWYHDAV